MPNASVLGSEQFPAPAAQAWKAVAEVVLSKGIGERLGAVKSSGRIVIGGHDWSASSCRCWRRSFPKYEKWIPSAAGVGLAWTFHWYYSLLFFLGAVHSATRFREEGAEGQSAGVHLSRSLPGIMSPAAR